MNHIELNNQVMIKKDGFYNIEADKQAIIVYQDEIDHQIKKFPTHLDKLSYLIENDYYINFFDMYSRDFLEELYICIYDYNFEFQSYMAISKFYQSYAMRTNDKKQFLERYEDRIIAVALFLGQGNTELAKDLAIAMIEQRYQPATPTFLNSGKTRRGELVSCFLLEMDDSLNSINYNLTTAMQLSKIGGGIAINLSKLRGQGEAIKDIEGAATGIIPVMKLMEDAFKYVNQLGQRPGAGAAYLNVFHWDVLTFLDTKKINADESSRIQTLSLGLVVPDIFFELARNNEDMYLFAPYTVFKATGKHLDDTDLDAEYYNLVNHKDIKKKKINPRDILQRIAVTQFESGYPYIVYKSTAQNENPLKNIGQIKMSNLCTEIFQIQETSTINNYDEADEIRRDISCNLGSLNVVNVMDHKSIRESVRSGMDALTAVSDITQIENAPGIRKANEEMHSVGLGAMNLHGFFAKNLISYESPLAIEFARTFFMMVNYYSIERSMEIARERNETFKDFEHSEYATGSFFNRYTREAMLPTHERIQQLFEGMTIPTPSDWENLKREVQKHGLYHAYRLAIAPTQSISYIQNATPSIMPVVDAIETRTYGNSTTYYPMPYLAPENFMLYKSAYYMDMMKIIDLVSEIQRHVDQGISTILFVDSNTSTAQLIKYYLYAHHKQLKSLYYTRTKNLTIEECIACAV